jgi:hypothetical protein
LSNQTLPSPQRSEPVNQFLRCVGKIRAAENAGEDPAPYVAQARQWLAIVKLANPNEAASLELELQGSASRSALKSLDVPAPWDRHLFLLRLAWIGVPFAVLFMVAGPSTVVQVFSGIALVWLLLFIFLK